MSAISDFSSVLNKDIDAESPRILKQTAEKLASRIGSDHGGLSVESICHLASVKQLKGEQLEICAQLIEGYPLQDRAKLIDPFLQLAHPFMTKKKLGVLLRFIAEIPPEKRLQAVQQSLDLIGLNPSSSSVNLLLTLQEEGGQAFQSLVDETMPLIDLSCPRRNEIPKILKGLRNFPAEKRKLIIEKILALCPKDASHVEKLAYVRVLDKMTSQGIELEKVDSYFKKKHRSFPNPPLKDLPRDLQWRLWMDRIPQCKGVSPNHFDIKESGYRRAMDECWEFVDRIQGCRMNPFLLLMLHDIAVNGVFRGDEEYGQELQPGYSSGDWYYGIKAQHISNPDVLFKEWEEEGLCYDVLGSSKPDTERYLSWCMPQNFGIKQEAGLKITSKFKDGDEARIDRIFESFYEEAAKAKTMDEKYAAVARCCRAIVMFHAFPDGNTRTTLALFILLLNYIGSPLSIVVDPVVFDGAKTIPEMVAAIKEGVEYYKTLKMMIHIAEFVGTTPVAADADDYQALALSYVNMERLVKRAMPDTEKKSLVLFSKKNEKA